MNQNYEKAVIGSILLEPAVMDTVATTISSADFIDSELGEFFGLLKDLADIKRPIDDLLLLQTEVKRRELSISNACIVELFARVPNAHNAKFYAESVREAARLRKLSLLADMIKDQTNVPGANSGDIADYVEAKIKLMDSANKIEISDAATVVQQYDYQEQASGNTIYTGIEKHDRYFGGFTGGELVLIGARLGTGKTALGWQIAIHNAQRGRRCLFVSLEMNSNQLLQRHLASELQIDSIKVMENRLTPDERDAIAAEKNRFAQYPVSIFSPPSATAKQIAAAVRLMSGRGIDLLVVDYIQYIRPNKSRERRQAELEETSKQLKEVAREHEIPVVALCQLNRQADESKAPKVSHIADSDNLGRDADRVLLLHRRQDSTDLRVAKHRYVADNAAIELQYRHGRFEEPGTDWTP
ncbi:MAG: DnaB-like helicase C-terminal domain-containing protein [Planctomycetota bacterium]